MSERLDLVHPRAFANVSAGIGGDHIDRGGHRDAYRAARQRGRIGFDIVLVGGGNCDPADSDRLRGQIPGPRVAPGFRPARRRRSYRRLRRSVNSLRLSSSDRQCWNCLHSWNRRSRPRNRRHGPCRCPSRAGRPLPVVLARSCAWALVS
ncbi:MAG: hypothetical protein MZV64_15840 [Ignavibacteriales bacterium]|nr:hypothetical protein [Ignavibacteriales bacterium]